MTLFHKATTVGIAIITCLHTAVIHANESLSIPEQEIVSHIRNEMPKTLDNLKKAVNVNSGSMNIEGVKIVGQMMMAQLESVGLEVEWQDGAEFNRAGHVVAQYTSKKPYAPKVLMIGHLDTVFSKDDDFQSYRQISEHEAAGPGIVDMKGGNSIIIAALSALKKANVLKDISVRVVMTGDEESSGRPLSLSKKAIVDGGKWADIALGFENGDSNIKTAMVARRGYVGWTLNVTGKPAHSSQVFRDDIGYGAIYETARILNTFRTTLSQEENLTFNPGLISGGTRVDHNKSNSTAESFGKANVIAKGAVAVGDIRALSVEQVERAKKVMHKIVGQSLPHTQATLVFESGYPPMSPSDGNKKLLSMYSQASQDLGYDSVVGANPRKAGAADISFAANHVDMALDGMGLMGRGGHTKDEVADLTSFQKNIEKAAVLLYRLSRHVMP